MSIVTSNYVLTHCKTNYMKQQWDPGAYVLFDESEFNS